MDYKANPPPTKTMAKPPNHIELNSTANIWAKQLSQEEES